MGVLAAAKLAVVALSVGVATGKTVADAKLPSRELLSSSASGDADAKRAATKEAPVKEGGAPRRAATEDRRRLQTTTSAGATLAALLPTFLGTVVFGIFSQESAGEYVHSACHLGTKVLPQRAFHFISWLAPPYLFPCAQLICPGRYKWGDDPAPGIQRAAQLSIVEDLQQAIADWVGDIKEEEGEGAYNPSFNDQRTNVAQDVLTRYRLNNMFNNNMFNNNNTMFNNNAMVYSLSGPDVTSTNGATAVTTNRNEALINPEALIDVDGMGHRVDVFREEFVDDLDKAPSSSFSPFGAGKKRFDMYMGHAMSTIGYPDSESAYGPGDRAISSFGNVPQAAPTGTEHWTAALGHPENRASGPLLSYLTTDFEEGEDALQFGPGYGQIQEEGIKFKKMFPYFGTDGYLALLWPILKEELDPILGRDVIPVRDQREELVDLYKDEASFKKQVEADYDKACGIQKQLKEQITEDGERVVDGLISYDDLISVEAPDCACYGPDGLYNPEIAASNGFNPMYYWISQQDGDECWTLDRSPRRRLDAPSPLDPTSTQYFCGQCGPTTAQAREMLDDEDKYLSDYCQVAPQYYLPEDFAPKFLRGAGSRVPSYYFRWAAPNDERLRWAEEPYGVLSRFYNFRQTVSHPEKNLLQAFYYYANDGS